MNTRKQTIGMLLGMASSIALHAEIPQVHTEILPAIRLRWPSSVGMHYVVQTSADLESWEDAGPVMRGTGGEMRFLAPRNGHRQFHRVAIPQSAVLMMVDISDPSAVKFTSTNAPALVNDSSTWPIDGVTLVGLFESDSPALFIRLAGSLGGPGGKPPLTAGYNGADGIPTRDLNLYEGWGVVYPVMNFSKSAPAFTGSAVADLSTASLVPLGTLGGIIAGNREYGSKAVLGSFQVMGAPAEVPRVGIEPLQALRLKWLSTAGLQYQVQVSPDLKDWANAGPILQGNGREMDFLTPHADAGRFCRLVVAKGLEILEARWGHDGVFKDVRTYIEGRIVDSTVSMLAWDYNFGQGGSSLWANDTLHVRYRNASGEYEAVVEELHMLIIPHPDHTKL